MPSLLLDSFPKDSSDAKDRDPAKHFVIGERVHEATMFSALLAHGTYDRYFYISQNPAPADRQRDDRLVAVDPRNLDALAPIDRLVLFTSSPWLAKYVPLREWCRRPEWALCGMTHALSPAVLLPQFMALGVANLRSHDAIVCTTEGARTTLRGIYEGLQESASVRQGTVMFPNIMTPVIANGVDTPIPSSRDRVRLRQELDLPLDAVIYLFVGRLSMVNKADFRPLIATFMRGLDLPNPSVLVLAGDDTRFHLTGELEAFGRALGGHNRLIVRPNITSSCKASLLHAADVFVALSDTLEETFGISVVEAMLAGLPVVASDWEGYRHLVRDGVDALLVPTSFHEDTEALSAVMTLFRDVRVDQVQRTCIDLRALRQALRVLGTDAQLRQRLGEAARARAQREYDWRTIIHRYEALWHEQTEHGLQAARTEDRGSGKPAAYFQFARAFGHYPTRLLSDDVAVACVPDSGSLPIAARLEEIERHIFELVLRSGPRTIGDIVRTCTRANLSASTIRTHASRLIKHGLLELSASLAEAAEPRHADPPVTHTAETV